MSTENEEKLSDEEIRAYWTPERMAEVKPMVWTPATTPKPDAEPEPTGEPEIIPGYNPNRGAASGIGLSLTASPVTSPTEFPWCTVGRLYFTAAGDNWDGSACVIRNRTLLTAAHNIYQLKLGWSKNFIFVPAKIGRLEPFGYWTGARMAVMDMWYETEIESYDVGIILLNLGGNNPEKLVDVYKSVGYLGLTYNLPNIIPRVGKAAWIDVGYPSSVGDTMYADPGTYTRSLDKGRIVCKTGTIGPGSSGGPWLTGAERDTVNGIHSYAQATTETGGPYFRDSVKQFIESWYQ
jgi:V8-like Glu-specific endopeptidase